MSDDTESDSVPVLNVVNPQIFDLIGPDPHKLERCEELLMNQNDNVYSATGDRSTLLIVTLSYGSKCVEVTIKSNSTTSILDNVASNPVTVRARLRIRQNGISIMPYMMTEFHCVYRFIW